jgi:hypothetical protein
MEFVGDLERVFAAAIYPNRVLIAIVAATATAVLAIIAWRRRWDLAARRHPRGALVVIVIVVAGLGPLGWYLGSPLFLSSSIDEPAPIVAARATASPDAHPGSPGISSSPSPDGPESPAVSQPSASDVSERTGSFTGADEFHFGQGIAILIETAPGTFAVRLEDFSVRNGPDLYVYLSPSVDGYVDGSVELGRLKADTGDQNYEVPPGTDISSARSVVIWCKQFAVLFATAPLG